MKLCVLVAVLLQFCALTCCQDMPDYDVEDMFTGQPSPGLHCTETMSSRNCEFSGDDPGPEDFSASGSESGESGGISGSGGIRESGRMCGNGMMPEQGIFVGN